MDKLILRPEILMQPNIPKPLHGLAPRTIKGEEWWHIARQKAYESTGFHCIACGTHKLNAKKYQWLEAHENWNIDHMTGKCEVKSIVPLCHYCHNFIHSGRLAMIINKEKSRQEVIDILENGFCLLAKNNLKVFPFTYEFAKNIGAKTFCVSTYSIRINHALEWKDYILILDGKEYTSKFDSYESWSNYYKEVNNG